MTEGSPFTHCLAPSGVTPMLSSSGTVDRSTYPWLLNVPGLLQCGRLGPSVVGQGSHRYSSRGRGCTAFYDTALQVLQHHFGHTLLVKNRPKFKQEEHREPTS